MKTNNPYTPFDEQLREQLASLKPEVPEGVWEAMESSLDTLNQNLQFDSAIRESVEHIDIPAPEGVFQAVQHQLGSGVIGSGLSIAGKWILGSVLAGVVATSVLLYSAKESQNEKNELVAVSKNPEIPAASELSNASKISASENPAGITKPETFPDKQAEIGYGAAFTPNDPLTNGTQAPAMSPTPEEPNSQPYRRGNTEPNAKPDPRPVFSFSATDTMLCNGQTYTIYISNADHCVYDVLINGVAVGQGKSGNEKFQYTSAESGLYHIQCLVKDEDGVWKKTQFLHVNPLPEVKLSKTDLGDGRYSFDAGEGGKTSWYLDGAKKAKGTIQLYDALPTDHRISAHVTNAFGCSDSAGLEFRNNVVFDVKQPNIPNVFSPNGDGKNDVYSVEIEGATHYQIYIFNRHSQVVFESNDPKAGWDGKDKYNQNRVESGTYTCIIDYALAGGEIIRVTKMIQLIKE